MKLKLKMPLVILIILIVLGIISTIIYSINTGDTKKYDNTVKSEKVENSDIESDNEEQNISTAKEAISKK